METVAVNVSRDGRFWYVALPEFDGATQARHLGEVEAMARDWLEATTDRTDFELEVTVTLPEEVQQHLSASQQLRDDEARARAGAAHESRLAARALKANGLTTRDIGAALGVSHQRAHQLLAS